MTEVIAVIERELQAIRNQIQGAEGKVEKLNESVDSEEKVIAALRSREANFVLAISKLKRD